jgi:hypothetical protein
MGDWKICFTFNFSYTYKFPTGVPNSSYICRKCGKGGHYIQNCTNEPVSSYLPLSIAKLI